MKSILVSAVLVALSSVASAQYYRFVFTGGKCASAAITGPKGPTFTQFIAQRDQPTNDCNNPTSHFFWNGKNLMASNGQFVGVGGDQQTLVLTNNRPNVEVTVKPGPSFNLVIPGPPIVYFGGKCVKREGIFLKLIPQGPNCTTGGNMIVQKV